MTVLSAERRAVVRYPVHQGLSCHLNPSMRGLILTAVIRDISVHGIGLLIGTQLASGLQVMIDVGTCVSDHSHAIPARVAHCTVEPDGRWFAGRSFLEQITDDEMQAILR